MTVFWNRAGDAPRCGCFTRAVSETLGEERKWVHYGLTSTDVVDTAYGYLYKQANDIIRRDFENFTNIIADKAKEHKFTI